MNPGIQCFLGRNGLWDQSGFVKMISSQKFGVIIMRSLDNGFWTDAIVGAIEKYYALTERLGDVNIEAGSYVVYRPRPKPGQP